MSRWKWAGTVVTREHVQKMDPKFRVSNNSEIVVSSQCHTHCYKNMWFYEHGFRSAGLFMWFVTWFYYGFAMFFWCFFIWFYYEFTMFLFVFFLIWFYYGFTMVFNVFFICVYYGFTTVFYLSSFICFFYGFTMVIYVLFYGFTTGLLLFLCFV